MKYVGYGFIIILALALQTVSPGLGLFGFRPELILLLTLGLAMLEEARFAAGFGFISGLLQDALIGQFIGLYAGAYLLMAVLVGLATRRFYKENFVVRFVVIFSGTVFGQILYLSGAASFGSSNLWSWATWSAILGTGLVNGILGVLLYRPFYAVNKRLAYLDELLKRTG